MSESQNQDDHSSLSEKSTINQSMLEINEQTIRSAEKRELPSHYWFQFYIGLVKRVARVFWNNHRVLWNKFGMLALCYIDTIIIDSSLQKHRHGSVWRCSWDWIILYSVHRILGKPLYLYVSGKGFSFHTKRTYKKNNPTITESAVPRMSRGNEIWKADCLIMSPSSKQSVLTYRKLKYWH